jgi:integrase
MTPVEITRAIKNCTNETVLRDRTGERGSGVLMLVLRRYSTGVTAMWTAMWQQDGKRRKLQLGRYPELGLADARAVFNAKVKDVLAAKRNPASMAVATERPTVQRLFDAYCDRMAADGKSSAMEVRRCLGFAAEHIGTNKLAGDVHASDVSAYLATIYARGAKVAADRVRSYLSAAFNFGLKSANDYRTERREDWGIQSNPAAAIQKDTSASLPRDRALSAGELATFWHALDRGGFALETRAALRLMICCGQRLRETLRMEAHEVDLDAGVWHMPAHKTKGGRHPHAVPLPSLAMGVIRELLLVHRSGPLMPIQDHAVTTAVMRWLNGAPVAHFQVRDLRRTWKSRAADAGLDRFTRDLIQQHAKTDTGSRHYDRADYLPLVTDAMKKWDRWLRGALVAPEQPSGSLAPLGALQAQLQA